MINNFLDEIHRPALPYKFKFKFSGCPNDCMNSVQRADLAIIGTWRDNIRTDEELARKWFAKHGMDELVNDVVARCPTKAIQLKEVKYRPGIDEHDFETKTRHARRFLEEKNKVKVTLMFRGRQIAHPELGQAVVERVAQELSDIAKVESPVKMEGKQLTMILAPK